MAGKSNKGEHALMYKGKPLVRSGNTIYYGDMTEPYVAMLQIQDTAAFADMHLPSRVSIQILSTNEELDPLERIKRRTEKSSIYEAINIASIWLERSLEEA